MVSRSSGAQLRSISAGKTRSIGPPNSNSRFRVLDLIVGILIPKSTLLLLFPIQSKAPAAGVDPPLTDLAPSPYRRFLGQGIRDLCQAAYVRYMSKTVPLLGKADPGFP